MNLLLSVTDTRSESVFCIYVYRIRNTKTIAPPLHDNLVLVSRRNMRTGSIRSYRIDTTGSVTDTDRIRCRVYVTVERPSVRPFVRPSVRLSVPPIDKAAACAGFAAERPAGRCRSTVAARCGRHAASTATQQQMRAASC